MKTGTWYKLIYSILRPIGWLLFPQRNFGRENVPEGPVILCANHSNGTDPILISFGLGKNIFVRHMAKAELRRVPVVGWVMSKVGSVFVHRGEQDIDSLRQCMKALRAGEKIILFPEGTRLHGSDMVEPKTGAIHLAARLGVPLLPVYLPRDKKLFRRIDVVFGKPYTIQVESREDYGRLARDLMERIWALGKRPG